MAWGEYRLLIINSKNDKCIKNGMFFKLTDRRQRETKKNNKFISAHPQLPLTINHKEDKSINVHMRKSQCLSTNDLMN